MLFASLSSTGTAQLEREDNVLRGEQWFRTLTENAVEMLTVLHADGSIKYLSPSAERFLGITLEQAVARSCSIFDSVFSEDLELAREEFQRCLEREGAPLQLQLRCRRADGELRHCVTVARNLLDDPVVQGIVLNTRDVTEQRELELQLQHAQRLDAIGRITGAVAHDFNNLITIIQGNACLAIGDLPPDHPIRNELQEIADAAQRATKLTRQLLSFSRQQQVNIEQFCAAEAVHDLARLLTRVMAPGQRLVLDVDPRVGTVRADRCQLDQVLMNLVTNARDAMPKGGVATLSCRAVELSAQIARFHPGANAGTYVVIAVKDTGIGMSADVKQRIFEPFFTTKDRSKGTGLGLPTAYGIVQQFGGFMTVESTEGAGTTFSVYLPGLKV